jgi:hypothetical protein
MTKLNLYEIDTIFISYDEPNADRNYAELVKTIPWAKRVHGVKGSDNAHKAAANLSETERFITVDADNIVDPKFFNYTIELTDTNSDCVFSWTGKNSVNGLAYGNGGLKCWTKKFVLDMKTHENSDNDDPRSLIEFCFDEKYIQINDIYSVSHINGSPIQAFRSGFREGVKMSLNEGSRWPIYDFKRKIYQKNYHRLLIWMNVGADVKNGLWAMYGARLGCYMTMLTDWDHVNVRDFEYINNLWESFDDDVLVQKIEELGSKLQHELDIPTGMLAPQQSEFFKEVYQNPLRMGRGLYDN